MSGATTSHLLPRLWVDNTLDLTQPGRYAVAGRMSVSLIRMGLEGVHLVRPRIPFAPKENRALPSDSPPGLKALYAIAREDMQKIGLEPDQLYLYTLHHSGIVEPDDCLRADFWHFDFLRNLRYPAPRGQLPVAIGYGVSSDIPTLYTTRLASPEGKALPARQTIADESAHDRLGEAALAAGFAFRPRPGDIVRYDSLLLHRGEPNRTAKPIRRVFMHVAFSPIPQELA